jgi:hypothetical protein
LTNKLTILPLALVDLATLVYEFAPALPLAVLPVSYVVVSVGVDIPAVTMVNIVFELALIYDMIDLLANSLHLSISTNLSDNKFAKLTLAKRHCLVNILCTVCHDVLKFQWS